LFSGGAAPQLGVRDSLPASAAACAGHAERGGGGAAAGCGAQPAGPHGDGDRLRGRASARRGPASPTDGHRQPPNDPACGAGQGEERPQCDAQPGTPTDTAVVLEGVEATDVAVSQPRRKATDPPHGDPTGIHSGKVAGADYKTGELSFPAPQLRHTPA